VRRVVSRKLVTRAAVDLAINEVCRRVGQHAACPIVLEVVRALTESRRPEGEELRRPVGVGEPAKPLVRPSKSAKATKGLEREETLLEDAVARDLPTLVPPIHRKMTGKAIAKGMMRHAGRQVVGAGGRTVQDIVTRLTAPGVNPRRREHNRPRGAENLGGEPVG